MKKSTLWQMVFAFGISAAAIPAFVQGQTSSGTAGSRSGMSSDRGGAESDDPSMGSSGTSRTPGSSHKSGSSTEDPTMKSPSSKETTGSSSTMKSGAAMTDRGVTEADRTLNSKLRQTLNADSSLEDSTKTIGLSSDNGKVTLRGTAPTEKDKQEIEKKVKSVSGVKEVDNQLQIGPVSSNVAR